MSGKNYDAGKEGEKSSWNVMETKGFYRPKTSKSRERTNIKEAFLMLGKQIEPRAFDLIDAKHQSLLGDPDKILAAICEGDFVLYELKTAGAKRKSDIGKRFKKLGFTITANEEHNHSVLGDDGFKFIFLNLKTDECMCLNYSDFYERSRVYLTKSIFVDEEITNGISL
tara:strand:- start:98 stop:604 length:507 start_codon:yes stop_codon:yes gene_type:complete